MEPQKRCFKCDSMLPLSSFYRHPMMIDGRLGKCKECTKKDVAKNYEKNRVKKSEYERQRNRDPGRRRKMKLYLARSKAMFPEKYRARAEVARAIRSGKMHPFPCEVCGSVETVQAHHEDYSRPLDVMWLCFKHHRERHGQIVVSELGAPGVSFRDVRTEAPVPP